uniref:Uncharacterized protein n=1 Tax=Arundo donax TaxID=35708 RepID=A0A0A9I217_ARUDO
MGHTQVQVHKYHPRHQQIMNEESTIYLKHTVVRWNFCTCKLQRILLVYL